MSSPVICEICALPKAGDCCLQKLEVLSDEIETYQVHGPRELLSKAMLEKQRIQNGRTPAQQNAHYEAFNKKYGLD